jgi:hypothetical protein
VLALFDTPLLASPAEEVHGGPAALVRYHKATEIRPTSPRLVAHIVETHNHRRSSGLDAAVRMAPYRSDPGGLLLIEA